MNCPYGDINITEIDEVLTGANG